MQPSNMSSALSSQKSPSTTRLRDDNALNASNNLRLELLIQTIKHWFDKIRYYKVYQKQRAMQCIAGPWEGLKVRGGNK